MFLFSWLTAVLLNSTVCFSANKYFIALHNIKASIEQWLIYRPCNMTDSKVLPLPSGGRSAACTQSDQSGFEWISAKFNLNINLIRELSYEISEFIHKTSCWVIAWCFSTRSKYWNSGLLLKYSDVLCLLPPVGFLQSGSKLLFRRRHREKEPCLSQSHEDISNMGNNFAAAATSSRKKSGSFSRRLIKRFSFRSSGKSKGKATATNGGASSLDNWLSLLWQDMAHPDFNRIVLRPLLLLSEEQLNLAGVFDRLNTPGGSSPEHLERRIPLGGLSLKLKCDHEIYFFRGEICCSVRRR